MGMILDLLVACFISYKKWVQREKISRYYTSTLYIFRPSLSVLIYREVVSSNKGAF